MSSLKRSSIYDVPSDQHPKRAKNDTTKGSHPRWRPLDTKAATICNTPAIQSNVPRTPEVDRSSADTAHGSRVTPPRQPTYTQLIEDALEANPAGLDTRGISDWLRNNRREAVAERGEKFEGSLQAALSAQANKKNRTIWKCTNRHNEKDTGPVIWTLWKHGKRADDLSTLPPGSDGIPNPGHDSLEQTQDTIRVSPDKSTLESRSTAEPRDAGPERTRRADRPSLVSWSVHQDTSAVGSEEAIGGATPNVEQPVEDGAANQSRNMHMELAPASPKPTTNGGLDISNEPSEETKLHLGALVLELHSLRDKRKMIKSEIERRQDSSPSIDVLEADAKHKLEQVKKLERKMVKARAEANRAVSDRDRGIEQAIEVTAKEQELAEVVQRLSETREALNVDLSD